MQSALHAATATLPHLRRGLSMSSAAQVTPHLLALTGAAAIALADTRSVLAIEGEGREQVRPGDLLSRLLERTSDDRMQIVPRLVSSDPSCPLRAAVLAPLTVQGKRAGTLITFYRSIGWPSGNELRVVAQAASLVSAQVELSVLSGDPRMWGSPVMSSFAPTKAAVGAKVTIKGGPFGGTSDVEFDGTPTQFKVNAAGTKITTVVPAGAKSGPITVVAADGAAKSSKRFKVT